MFMCSDPGQALIMEDLKNGIVDRVVVASCAPSLHETTFRGAISRAGANPYIYDHANIREQVSWVHHGDTATDKATRLVSMAAAKAEQLVRLEAIRVDAKKHATVIGGGIAGLRAAKDLAARGIEVALLEKSPFIGGQLANLDRIAPTGDNAADLVSDLARQVLDDDSITVHTCSEIEAFEGYVGNFKVGVKKQLREMDQKKIDQLGAANQATGEFIPFAGVYNGAVPAVPEEFTIETGVIILATGFKSYIPYKVEYGFGEYEQVITLPELIRSIAENKSAGNLLKFNGRKIRSMAMIHCVGSRQIPGIHPENEGGYLNEYCSRTCCTAALNESNIIRTSYPGTRVFEFYRDIRTYGRGQEELYEETARNQVVFHRFEDDASPEVMPNAGRSGNSP
ncbi:MAG: CoB--CoM heterodisulfide reductase iron-sulfur subunit A family protein, partial [Deltaproteobacteria bacterium]|nr:CoB--CoM heterodisulfide reductase iron-sulfur subunit A family protein [Deltaproteobacteria bacterium]